MTNCSLQRLGALTYHMGPSWALRVSGDCHLVPAKHFCQAGWILDRLAHGPIIIQLVPARLFLDGLLRRGYLKSAAE